MLPLIKSNERKYLYFYIPVFSLTLILNIMVGAGFKYVSITKILEGFADHFF